MPAENVAATRRQVTSSPLTALALVFLLALGAYARIAPATSLVFGEGGPTLLGNDPYYHLRHTRFCVANFPELQRWDVGTGYPRGERANTPGLFQVAMAASARAAGRGSPDEPTLLTVMAWTPVVLGCLALALVWIVVRRLADGTTALLAVVLLTLYPATFMNRTLLGFADHHAAEVVLLLGILWGLASALQADADDAGGRAWPRAAARALPVALLLYTWNGAPLYLAVVGAALLATIALAVATGVSASGMAGSLARYGIAVAALVGIPPLVWPTLIMDPPTFALGLIGCGLLAAVPPAYAWLTERLRRAGWPARWLVLWTMAGAIALVGLVLWASPRAMRAVSLLLTPRAPWVAEHGDVSAAVFWLSLGAPGVIALAGPAILLVVGTGRTLARLPALFATVLTALMIALWIRVHDYEYVVPPLSAISAALIVHALLDRVGVGVSRAARRRRAVAVGLAAVAFALPVWPLAAHPLPWLTESTVRRTMLVTDGWRQAMDWMAARTPEPTLSIGTSVAPFGDFHYPEGTYGVLAAWDYGNVVSALGRRPTVASQGASRPVAEWLLASDEGEAIRRWASTMQAGERVRYAVIGAATVSDHFASALGLLGRDPMEFVEPRGAAGLPAYNERFTRSLMWRLYHDAGGDTSRHRLVYQSPHKSLIYFELRPALRADGPEGVTLHLRSEPMDWPGAAQLQAELARRGVLRGPGVVLHSPLVLPTVRIFEVVQGVTVSGSTEPNASVEVSLPLRSLSDGTEWIYRRTVTARADGGFTVTLPYATESSPISDVVARGAYRVDIVNGDGGRPARSYRLDVPEGAVLYGEHRVLTDMVRESASRE